MKSIKTFHGLTRGISISLIFIKIHALSLMVVRTLAVCINQNYISTIWGMYCNISSVVEFEINILKGNHCILRTRGAPICQKFGMILETKVVQKLKLEKNLFTKKMKLIFLNDFLFLKTFHRCLTYKNDFESTISALCNIFLEAHSFF